VKTPESEILDFDRMPRQFVTTQWRTVLAAAGSGEQQDQALEQLCRTYWYPLYAFVRRRGNGPEDAQDLTQEFFARLLEKKWLEGITPDAGRFRSFLLTALTRFLANAYDYKQAKRRGGGKQIISLDQAAAEARYSAEPVTTETPEMVFERRWALTLLDQAMQRLRQETASSGKTRLFELLSPFLSREATAGEYAAIAQELGVSPGAVGVSVHRLRHRYRALVEDEVGSTVSDPAQLQEEMRHLFAALRTNRE
jgi:RNA polymerase sigma factor (sigma-70 family)